MGLRLEHPPEKPAAILSTAICETISKAWQAAAFLEEMRNDLKKVRQSAARDMASGAFATAITHLILGANLLQPTELLQRPQIEAAEGGT